MSDEFDSLVGSTLKLLELTDRFKAESIVETVRDWNQLNTLDDVKMWFMEKRKNTPMKVKEIPLKEVEGWSVDSETGNITHFSNEFFIVNGVRVSSGSGREVGGKGWDQPMLTQVGYDGGILGILRKRINGIPHYLLEAKAEPGNYEIIQLSPTLQATFSNLKQAHQGRKPNFSEYFEEPESSGAKVLYKAWLSEDGGRLMNKRNLGMLIEVDDGTEQHFSDDFMWCSLYQIKELLHENAWVNPHIRGIIAHM